ncbi:MAG: DNA-directed RNA polymerase subunit beta' [Actinobacteria bacterium]|nr:DNA-directed RNA polymerase subunit beta' [Actinomycetota bacterium]MCL5770744.1 DNA-directed RNA polymerase subunit beta' [Actinomycetota bacterium]
MSISIDVNNFDALRIGLASPEKIRSWSNGEVKKPETINYRTLKPEKDGLFCERIFGPTKDWECYCGKYKRVRFKGIICERCGVEVTRSSVRRERMGHIELASPVSHIWFFKGVPSRLGYILGLTPKDLEKVLYFDSYIIISINKDKINAEKDKIRTLYEDYLAQMEELHDERIKEIKTTNEDFLKRYKEGEPLTELEAFDDSEIESEKDIEAKIAKIIKENEKLLEEEEEIYQEQIELVKKAQALFHNLEEKMLISDENLFKKLREIYGAYFKGGMGAEAIKELLKNIDCEKEVEELKFTIETSKGQKRSKAIKTLKILSSFVNTNNKPEYMILDVLPVIPPDLRPMVQLDGGRFATSDLNDLYRRVINRNNRLKKLLELDAPEIIINNEKRMLQEAVDALFDNGRRGRAVLGAGNRPLKSLSDMLKGKQGRFRQNLLGKRVDYSGRSVIVVNPNLRLDQCGLPKQIALELFKPFVMKKLVDAGFATNIKSAKIMVERGDEKVWDILEAVIKNHPVLLNRAPTLHRLGIQAFMPILVEGKAIQIHPLVCPPFNADFDGDQMAVHVPLSNEAKAEAIILMLASNNILSPANGEPVSTPSQDMVLGVYYLTSERIKSDGKEKYYSTTEDALRDYDYGFIKLHTPIKVKIQGKVIKTTAGRILFNEALPEDFEFVNKEVAKKELISIINRCIKKYPNYSVVEVLDNVKRLGFLYSTKSGLTIGIDDIIVPPKKKEILKHAEENIEKIENYYQQGMITDDERHERVIQSWSEANESVAEAMERNFDRFNPIYMMATSGARGNIKQLRQLAGMRGLVANARGDIIDRPIKSNFREGLTVLEYFLSTHGARQGLADTALRTADSGYLTRRLVDVSHDTMIRINDCGTDDGINLYVLNLEGEPNPNLIGRSSQEDVKDPVTGEILVSKGTEIDEEILQKLVQANILEINVRSPLTCEAEAGLCQKCYGRNLSSGKVVDIGEAVGIIAAQSIGEPGTQLTMRTFHTGGVASTVIQRSIKSPVKGKLVLPKELLNQLGLKIQGDILDYVSPPSEQELYGVPNNMLKINIESIPHKLTFKVKMEQGEKSSVKAGQLIDIVMPKGEELLLTNNLNVDRNQVFAILISTAKKKRYIHKHEKTFEGMDITSGLPRVVELFEARKPKEHAIISEAAGNLKIEEMDSQFLKLSILNNDGAEEKSYEIPSHAKLRFNEGDFVQIGDQLTEGQRNPHDILRLNGIKACEQYLVREIRDVYKAQGVEINDKHIEVIVRQMLKKVTILESGDSNFLPGQLIDRLIFEKENKKLIEEGKKPALAKQNLMGITKAALATDSFLSAASFQETTRVLTDAAIENKTDYLIGLKENVIIGKNIPAGTGMTRYRTIELTYPGYKEENNEDIEMLKNTDEDEGNVFELNI